MSIFESLILFFLSWNWTPSQQSIKIYEFEIFKSKSENNHNNKQNELKDKNKNRNNKFNNSSIDNEISDDIKQIKSSANLFD